MTANDLLDQFIVRLLREQDGTRQRWRRVLGPVRVYSAATHPHCNWSITPTGTVAENRVVENLSDDLRIRYPLIER